MRSSTIEERSPRGADNVKIRLRAATDLLADHPHSGQMTNTAGLRRIVANPYPYVIFYQPTATEVVVHSVRHAARRPRR
jgi:toxin ParE1/3/4